MSAPDRLRITVSPDGRLAPRAARVQLAAERVVAGGPFGRANPSWPHGYR